MNAAPAPPGGFGVQRRTTRGESSPAVLTFNRCRLGGLYHWPDALSPAQDGESPAEAQPRAAGSGIFHGMLLAYERGPEQWAADHIGKEVMRCVGELEP